jgi:uncharacterized protein YfdQ (DUF2303 family)
MSEEIKSSGNRELAQWAYTVGKNLNEIKPATVKQDLTVAQLACVPEKMHIIDLKKFLPAFPDRKIGMRTLLSLGSYIELVNEQKRPESRVFAHLDTTPITFTCVVDYHERGAEGKAGWNEFSIDLKLKHSAQYKTWIGINDKLMPQMQFAEFLKDNRLDVAKPAGADILELVNNLEAAEDSRYKGKLPTNEGMRISFDSTVTTNVTIPNKITLGIPLFEEGEELEVDAEFKLRVKDGSAYFGIRLLGIERMVRDAVQSVRQEIVEKTGLPVFV